MDSRGFLWVQLWEVKILWVRIMGVTLVSLFPYACHFSPFFPLLQNSFIVLGLFVYILVARIRDCLNEQTRIAARCTSVAHFSFTENITVFLTLNQQIEFSVDSTRHDICPLHQMHRSDSSIILHFLVNSLDNSARNSAYFDPLVSNTFFFS